jgi:hypothetical protein
MKSETNCAHCWTKNRERRPAALEFDDEPLCIPCARAAGLSEQEIMNLREKTLAAQAVIPEVQTVATINRRHEPSPALESGRDGAKWKKLPCSTPGCDGQYGANSTSKLCKRCRDRQRGGNSSPAVKGVIQPESAAVVSLLVPLAHLGDWWNRRSPEEQGQIFSEWLLRNS